MKKIFQYYAIFLLLSIFIFLGFNANNNLFDKMVLSRANETLVLLSNEGIEQTCNESDKILEVASLLITWSGVVLSFLTIIAGFFGFFGFKEIRSIHKLRDNLKKMKDDFEEHQTAINVFEENNIKHLSELTEHFETSAQSIMQATYYFTMGLNSYYDAKYNDVIIYLNKSLIYLPRSTDSLCLIGRAYIILGEMEKSKEYFENALEIEPNCSAAYRGLAAWYRNFSIEKALENARKAVEIDSENYENWDYLGQLLRDQGNLSSSLEAHLKAYSIKNNPDTNFFLSLLYIEENSLGRAKKHIRYALDLYENNIEFSRSRPIWKHLARWVYIIITENEYNNSSEEQVQLDLVAKNIDNKRTQINVLRHIDFLLTSLGKDEKYVVNCKRRVIKYD